jgi:recombination protein RecT
MSTTTQPAVAEKDITTQVLQKVQAFEKSGELRIPKDYSPENALKGAMLVLTELKTKDGSNALQYCSKTSIAQALLKMVVEGLSVLKKQGYFIPYDKELTWIRSYQGSIALAKRVAEVKEVNAVVVYQNDLFEYGIDVKTGRQEIYKHINKLENIANDKIIAAYAIVIYKDGSTTATVMTMEQIRAAWNQGATRGNSPAHKNFTEEMAKKTVINRACKTPINSSTDVILVGGYDEDTDEPTTIDIKHEIVEDTASEQVTFEIEANEPKSAMKSARPTEAKADAEPSEFPE